MLTGVQPLLIPDVPYWNGAFASLWAAVNDPTNAVSVAVAEVLIDRRDTARTQRQVITPTEAVIRKLSQAQRPVIDCQQDETL